MISLQALRGRWGGGVGTTLVAVLAGLLAAPEGAVLLAQEPPPASAAAEAPDEVKLSGDQLEALVAPIALYPDPLLAQVLVASTYPVDVIAAQQWLSKNTTLKGEALEKALQEQAWDPSVQALVPVPDALKMLGDNIKWTQDLGDAFLAQQGEVMDAVQRLRTKAKDGGKLASSEQQTVETKVVEDKTIIEIEPTSTEVIYVPSYSPSVVWGVGYYPYPPMYYPPYYGGAWIGFGVGIAVGIGIAGGWPYASHWGGGGNNTININNNNNYVSHHNSRNNSNRTGNSNWQHNPQQRGGAPYRDKATANKYGGSARGDSMQSRQGQGFDRGGASAGDMSRGGGGGGGGYSAGSRDVSPSNRSGGSSAFGDSGRGSSGSSFSGSSARSSSSRGTSSMGGSRGGGMSRGGGGGGRRR
jgi:uncharacterized membrane protein YgcG